MNRIKAMKITKKVPKGPREPKSTSEFFEDVELYENIKLRTIKRKLLGKRTFPYIKKQVNFYYNNLPCQHPIMYIL